MRDLVFTFIWLFHRKKFILLKLSWYSNQKSMNTSEVVMFFCQIGWSAGTAVWSYGLLHRKAVFLCTNALNKSFRHKPQIALMWCLTRRSSLLSPSFQLLIMEETDGIQFFAQLLLTMDIISVDAEGVQRYNKTVWRPKYKIWFNTKNKCNRHLICCFHHDFLTHNRPPACKSLVWELCWYICSGIIISIQLKALIQSYRNQSTHCLWHQWFHSNLIFRSFFCHSCRWSLALTSQFSYLLFILFFHSHIFFQAFPLIGDVSFLVYF